jgi:hypothetical protein
MRRRESWGGETRELNEQGPARRVTCQRDLAHLELDSSKHVHVASCAASRLQPHFSAGFRAAPACREASETGKIAPWLHSTSSWRPVGKDDPDSEALVFRCADPLIYNLCALGSRAESLGLVEPSPRAHLTWSGRLRSAPGSHTSWSVALPRLGEGLREPPVVFVEPPRGFERLDAQFTPTTRWRR